MTDARHCPPRSGPVFAAERRAGGFTLFELMIVVLIILAVSIITVPNVDRTLQTFRLDGSASMIYNKTLEARLNAIKRNRQAWLAIDSDNGEVQVRSTDDTPETIDVGTPGLLQRTVGFQEGTPVEIRFDSMGRPTVARTIVIETADMEKTITISATGRIRVN